jgi:signal transduction histidine kinase
MEQPRILIADSDQSSAGAHQRYLTRQGYYARIASNGAALLADIPHFRPHLLLIDFYLQDMTGLEVTLRLRSDPRQAYIPVIITTAQPMHERMRLHGMLSGADDYLSKPVNQLELLVRVQALIRTKYQLDRLLSENRALLEDLAARNKELEGALLEVREASLLKERIFTSVSHEMGTPMLQIKTALRLMQEDQPSDRGRLMGLADQAAGRLEGIIQNFADLARSEKLKIDPFILGETIESAVRNIERKSDREALKPERIQRQLPPKVPLLLGDKRAVTRIITLLLDNALKFDPDHHPVVIFARPAAQEERYEIGLRDQGIGIPPEHLTTIFEPFQQVDDSPTRRFGGSGLGLTLAKVLCDRMGSHLQVQSRPGKGSTFWFDLPTVTL